MSEELERMAREQRRFTILQRERAMSDAQKGKTRAAIMAGACILGTAATMLFNPTQTQTVIDHELQAVYSWDALRQYFSDIGPLTTLLTVGAAGFIGRYMQNSRQLKKAKEEFEDFNASLENTRPKEEGR